MTLSSFLRGTALLGLLLGLGLPAQARWTHYAPAQGFADQPLALEFLDPAAAQAADEARLWLEMDGRSLPAMNPSTLEAGRVVFTLPAGLLTGAELAYRVEFRLGTQRETAPESGSWRLPLAAGGGEALVLLLSETEIQAGEDALLAFSAVGDKADLSTARLLIDGNPAGGEFEKDPWLVTWRGVLGAGRHAVELQLKDRQGRDLPAYRSFLTVEDGSRVPTGISASSWQEFNMDWQDSREMASVESWQRYHAGQLRFHAWRGRGEEAWNLRGRVLLSAVDLEHEDLQPQSRLSLELERKGFLLGLGDRQPELGGLVLNGTRVRGAELNAEFKDFGLHVVGGRSQEARDPGAGDNAAFSGAFARDLYGLDLRMGRAHGLFEGGFSVMKAKDDVESISGWDESQVAPQDNAVLGARLDFNAFKGSFTVRNQAAFSLYNSNITDGAWTKDDLDSLGGAWEDLPDPSSYDDIIVINEYFSPLDLADGDVLTATALSSNWQLALGPNETTVDFRRVGGAYRSLGNGFLSPDRQDMRFSDRFRLWRNQIYVDLGAGQSTDNLDGQNDGSVGTTTRDQLSVGLGFYPKGRDLQVRLGFEQQGEKNEALDIAAEAGATTGSEAEISARSQQVEGSLNQIRLGVGGAFTWHERRQQWSLNLVTQAYSDEVGQVLSMDGADTLRADRSFGGSQFSLGWKTPLVMDARLDAAISLYSTDYDDASMTDYGHWSLRAAVGRPWLNKRLESTLRLQFQSVSSESAEESMSFTRLDLGGQLDWRFRQGMELAARVDWQSWAGDREDGYLKTVLRLSQEF
jgi:hypothetical protein